MEPLAKIDQLIRSGQLTQARGELDRSRHANRPASLANLFWRSGQPMRGLRALAKSLPELSPEVLEAHPLESAEYAACLIRLGAYAEARWMLERPKVAASPKAELYLGYSHLETWECALAIPHFQRFVEQSDLEDYWKYIGQVNLAACYVYEREHGKARPILNHLLKEAQVRQYTFLMGYVLETAAADDVLSGDFKLAHGLLGKARGLWDGVDGTDQLFLEKWTALLGVMERPDEAAIARVIALQKHAADLGHWETVRDCDRYRALRTRDVRLFTKLFFGTPYPAFRQRLRKDFGEVGLPERYLWTTDDQRDPTKKSSLLLEGEGESTSPLRGQSHRLLSLLASDFYRPHRLATIFARLFPEEHYHPTHGKKRMYEAVRRLTGHLRDKRIALKITESQSHYSLQLGKGLGLWIPQPGGTEEAWRPLPERLRESFGAAAFSISEALAQIPTSRRTLIRHLQALVAHGQASVSGSGPATRYRLITSK